MDVCGGAGTGKSYTINAILQEAKIRGHGVQVIAPTGSASSQFLGGRTIHSYLKLPVIKGKDKSKFDNLGEVQAQQEGD